MKRKQLEQICTSIGILSLMILTLAGFIGVADVVFNLDILSKTMEKFALLVMGLLFITVVSSVLVSIMLNISIIAGNMSNFMERKNHEE